jgi:hypothetical protein
VERGGGRVATLALAVFAFTLAFGACASTPRVLEGLKRDVTRARAAPKDTRFEAEPRDVSALKGMTTQEIVLALGEPDCPSKESPACDDGASLRYDLYHLPEGSDGGGLELLIFTDENGRCRDTRWEHSE